MDREFDGKTALHHAAFAGHSDVIKTLLEFGADKDIIVSIYKLMLICAYQFTTHGNILCRTVMA